MASPPDGWFWGKLHVPRAGLRKLGYRYVDPMAGPSFRVLCDLGPPSAMAPAIELARQGGFSMSSIVRLGGHETLRTHASSPPEIAAFHAKSFESGGAVGTVVWELGAAEREALGLPIEPPWAVMYRGGALPVGAAPIGAPPAPPSPGTGGGTRTPGAHEAPRRLRAHAGHYVIGGFGVLLLLACALCLVNPPSGSFELTDEYPIVVLVTGGLGALILGWIVSSLWGAARALLAMVCVLAPVTAVFAVRYAESLEQRRFFEERVGRMQQVDGLCEGGAGVTGPVIPGTVLGFSRSYHADSFSSYAGHDYDVGVVPDGQFPERVACVTGGGEEVLETAAYDDPSSDEDRVLRRVRVTVEVRVVRATDGAVLGQTVLRGGEPRPFAMSELGSVYGAAVDPQAIRAYVASLP